jgi:hypothetical protein
MKQNRIFFAVFICAVTLVVSGFSKSKPYVSHADEAEILHFEYTNFDGGIQYINDKDSAFFPFINTSGHDITLINMTSKNKYNEWSYEPLSFTRKITFKDQQRDTFFFRRINRGELKAGLYDQSWELSFEGIEQKQYLNIFCELQNNQGKLTAAKAVLPTVKRGEKITFESTVKNTGKNPVDITFLDDWNGSDVKALDRYPIAIEPGDSTRLSFELQTATLYNTYSRLVYFGTNTDDHDRFVISYGGSLISDKYPSIRFDTTALTLNTYQGGPGDYAFWFTNDGSEPLIITMVKTSCGCLVPSYPKEPIMPGERNVIKVHYDTNRIGPINKSVTVSTNISDYPIVLRVLGNVTVKE